jgi:hypothetical protein
VKTRVEKLAGLWLASCPSCPWTYHSRDLPRAHDEATFHTCQVRLGPRPLATSISIAATEGSTVVWAEQPATNGHRMEVWL